METVDYDVSGNLRPQFSPRHCAQDFPDVSVARKRDWLKLQHSKL
jgi:hypothetical protein